MRLAFILSILMRNRAWTIFLFLRSWEFSKYRLWRRSMRCPDLFTSRLNLRRADSIGSPSPTCTLMSTFRDVGEAGGATVFFFPFASGKKG